MAFQSSLLVGPWLSPPDLWFGWTTRSAPQLLRPVRKMPKPAVQGLPRVRAPRTRTTAALIFEKSKALAHPRRVSGRYHSPLVSFRVPGLVSKIDKHPVAKNFASRSPASGSSKIFFAIPRRWDEPHRTDRKATRAISNASTITASSQGRILSRADMP
jgi:hypothetical protein